MSDPIPTELLMDAGIIARELIYNTAKADADRLIARYSNYSAATYSVKDQLEYDLAVQDMRAIKGMADQVESTRDDCVRPLNTEVKLVNGKFKAITMQLDDLMAMVKRKALAYTAEQKRIVAEEEARQRAIARKREDKLREQAEAARAAGRAERADLLEDRASSVTVAPTPAAVPKAEGIGKRQVPKYRIDNPKLVPMEYYTLDEKKIAAVVRALKTAANIPGVTVWMEDDLSVRGS